ncbi:MAG: phosphatase PAP2 family protein [Candidatus Diapherotrites archaeon]|nr:phosphatase PAP2 family protein [Candidatus Diapherotrites archaeon]
MVFEEIAVNQFLQSYSTPALDLFFKGITYFGHPGIWLIFAAWLFWLGYERKSFILVSIILFAGAVAGALKIIIARPRPEGIIIMDAEQTFSMPSGHSTLIASFTSFFWARKVRNAFKALLVIAVVLVAISRMYLGAHYLTDVIVGLILGVVVGWLMYKAEGKINKMQFHITKIQDEFLAIGFFVIAVIFYMFIQSAYPEAFVLFGYFAGYALYRHSGVDLKPSTINKKLVVLMLVGTGILGELYLAAHKLAGLESVAIYFVIGLFITVFWPIITNELTQKKRNIK